MDQDLSARLNALDEHLEANTRAIQANTRALRRLWLFLLAVVLLAFVALFSFFFLTGLVLLP